MGQNATTPIPRAPEVPQPGAGVGLDGTAPPAPLETKGPGRITLTPVQAKIGDRVTVSGEGFTPSRPVDLIWYDQSGTRGTVGKASFNTAGSMEPLILATVFAVWVGIGPFAGVMALGIHSIASLGKLYSEQIESIDPGPIEAITATGASMPQGGG